MLHGGFLPEKPETLQIVRFGVGGCSSFIEPPSWLPYCHHEHVVTCAVTTITKQEHEHNLELACVYIFQAKERGEKN